MLQIGLYSSIAGSLYLDASPRASNVVLVTGEHGFGTLTFDVRLSIWEAFQLYDRPGLMHVQVTEWGLPVWQGRLEDVRITPAGVTLTALGYWRALSDVPYTALWSITSIKDWRQETQIDVANRNPQKYTFDQTNRLYIGLTKNTVYGNNADIAVLTYATPYSSARSIVAFKFDYAILLPTNWLAVVVRTNEDFSGAVIVQTITGTGALLTGTVNQTFTGMARVEIAIYNATGGNYTMAGETGAFYLQATNLRIKTTTSAALYADEIAKALAADVNAVNSLQLSASGALISSPTVDLTDELYQDMAHADILDRLAKLGDNSSPPVLFETGVWENQLLTFQKRGATARTWFVDITALELERTINALYNSAYADYQEASGRTLRTANNNDLTSQSQYGVIRRKAVKATTTSATQAATQRDAVLQDGKDPQPRLSIQFDHIFDGAGALWPLWAPRAWDTLVIRNLPATLSTALDRIRQFRIIETRYDVDNNLLTVTPESFTPSLDILLLRRAAGVP